MTLLQTFYTAVRSLTVNKTRTFLTTLGVIIGVFAVISLVSLVQGVRNYITDQFSEIGSDLFFIAPGKITGIQDDPSISFSTNKLKEEQVELIEDYAGDYVVGVTPIARLSQNVSFKTNTFTATVAGVNDRIDEITNLKTVKGRFFNESEVRNRARVAVIHPNVAEELFGRKDRGLGDRIKVGNSTLEIIGVAAEKNREFDERLTIPISTMKDILDVDQITFLGVKAKGDVDVATRQVELAMLRELKKDDFTILSQQDILESVGQILDMLSLILGAIAGISLLVGGIGIMNIMLVSVTERTREIGLRKALGATSINIATQFLIESTIISFMGGFFGLLFGWFSTLIAQSYIQAQIPLWACCLGIGFSLLVGVAFGTYPATQAAKKDPIEALRYE